MKRIRQKVSEVIQAWWMTPLGTKQQLDDSIDTCLREFEHMGRTINCITDEDEVIYCEHYKTEEKKFKTHYIFKFPKQKKSKKIVKLNMYYNGQLFNTYNKNTIVNKKDSMTITWSVDTGAND